MIRLPIELFLALRYLRPKRAFFSIITLISVIGVALGVGVLIIVISVMSGFDKQLRESLLGFGAHLKITTPGFRLGNYQEVRARVLQHPEVTGAAPFVLTQALIDGQRTDSPLVPLVKGVDAALERDVNVIHDHMVDGAFDMDFRGLVIGVKVADRLGLRVGDRLPLYSAREIREIKEAQEAGREVAPLPDEFEVRGVFDMGYHEIDQAFILCSLEDAQEFLSYEDADDVSALTVMISDPEEVGRVERELEALLGSDYVFVSWIDDNAYMLDALVVEKNVMFYILFFIMIVAAFGITSALITFVVQKTREIGVLKSLGATQAQVIWLFLSQSVTVGVAGVSAGFGLGLLAIRFRNEFLAFMRRVTGFELFPDEIYHFRELPALIVPQDIGIICGASLMICVLAGVIPAWSAARLRPVEALRHD